MYHKKKRFCIILSLLLSISIISPVYADKVKETQIHGDTIKQVYKTVHTKKNGANYTIEYDKDGNILTETLEQGTKYDTTLAEEKAKQNNPDALSKKEALERDKAIVAEYKNTSLFPEEYFIRGLSVNNVIKSLSDNDFVKNEMKVENKNFYFKGKNKLGTCDIDIIRRSYFDTEGARKTIRDDIYSTWEYFNRIETAAGAFNRISCAAYIEVPGIDWNDGKVTKGTGKVFRFIYHNGYNHIVISGDISARDAALQMVKSWGLYKKDLPAPGFIDFNIPVYNPTQVQILNTLANKYKKQ